jgi:hypothetical protein
MRQISVPNPDEITKAELARWEAENREEIKRLEESAQQWRRENRAYEFADPPYTILTMPESEKRRLLGRT